MQDLSCSKKPVPASAMFFGEKEEKKKPGGGRSVGGKPTQTLLSAATSSQRVFVGWFTPLSPAGPPLPARRTHRPPSAAGAPGRRRLCPARRRARRAWARAGPLKWTPASCPAAERVGTCCGGSAGPAPSRARPRPAARPLRSAPRPCRARPGGSAAGTAGTAQAGTAGPRGRAALPPASLNNDCCRRVHRATGL